MNLLAGSVDVEVEEFLHAGYLSASPRTLEQFRWFRYDDPAVEVVDLADAVALKDTSSTSNATSVHLSRPPLPSASLAAASDLLVFGVVVLFFAAVATSYLNRLIGARRYRLWFMGALLVLTVLVVGVVAGPVYRSWQVLRLNNLPPPWQDVPVCEFQDPEAATQVILHGLIVNGLVGCSFEVKTLVAIQNEVTWPLDPTRWTPGMVYAAKTYGRDGWGREFRLEPLGRGACRITSAGQDGRFGTADDIAHTTPKRDRYNWEPQVGSVYVQDSNEGLVFLVHRVAHRNFRVANAGRARELTGSELFDAVPEHTWLSESEHWPLVDRMVVELKKQPESVDIENQRPAAGLLLLLLHESET